MTVYRATRNLYQRLFNREHWRYRQAQKALFEQFVKPTSLVFDIGANRGEVSETFLALGATTVAVEPNPALAASIARHHGRGIHVENVAVGAQPGRAELNLGNDSGHSTLSTEWMERAPGADRWHGTVSTEVTTLDALIEKYGSPDFVKIDVEAYEAEVLAGLTSRLPAMCFEYQGAYPEVSQRCIRLLGDEYEYALTEGETPALTTPWLNSRSLLALLNGVERDAYGDVFARRGSGAA